MGEQPRHVLVTGATGFLGRALVPLCLEAGFSVSCLRRHRRRRVWPDWPVTWVEGDLQDARSLVGVAEGVWGIIHAGARVSGLRSRAYDQCNVVGTRALVTEATRAGVQRFVLVSSLAAADRCGDAYGESKRLAESQMHAFQGLWTIVRPGVIYGPGDRRNIGTLLALVRHCPWVAVLGDGSTPLQPVYVQDVARGLVRVLSTDTNVNDTLTLTGHETITIQQLVQLAAACLGVRRHLVRIPVRPFQAAAKLLEGCGIRPLISSVQFQRVITGYHDSSSSAWDHLGLELTPFTEGLRATLVNVR